MSGHDGNVQVLDPPLDLVVHFPDKHQWLESDPAKKGVDLELGEEGEHLGWMLVMKRKECPSWDGVDGYLDGQSCGLMLEEEEV